MDARNLLRLSSYLAHDARAIVSLGTTSLGESECATIGVSRATTHTPVFLWPNPPSTREQPPVIDDLAGILLPILFEPHHGIHELSLTLQEGFLMVRLVFLIDAIPFCWVWGLVCLLLQFHREFVLDELEPDLARLTLDLWGVLLDQA